MADGSWKKRAGVQRAIVKGGVDEAGIIKAKYKLLTPVMDERARRWWVASEALVHGRGGITLVCRATGMDRNTVTKGMREIQGKLDISLEASPERIRIRRPGGGRKSLAESDPMLKTDLENLIDPVTRGYPMSPLLWTCKSLRHLASELKSRGHVVSPQTVGDLLHQMDFSLQANRKTREGTDHPDRNAQFEYVAAQTQQFMSAFQPVISVDSKKRELIGNYKNAGREWRPKGSPEPVLTHDFPDKELGKATINGVYDVGKNSGWVSVGTDHDTAEFAVETVRRWWKQMGSKSYPQARQLLITADAGGSNSYRSRLWKLRLQDLADETGLQISVCHFPPGTSKWNKIEHRMFCHITQNWRSRPLISHAVIVNLISRTTTQKGLSIQACLDTNLYPKGIKVKDKQMVNLDIRRAKFHGEWNYTIWSRDRANITEK